MVRNGEPARIGAPKVDVGLTASPATRRRCLPMPNGDPGLQSRPLVLYGKGSDLAAQWGKARRDELDQGRLDLEDLPLCANTRATVT